MKQFGAAGEIEAVGPAPKSSLVAIVSRPYHLTVFDDNGQKQFDGDLESSGAPAIYWNGDESRLIIFSFPDESDEADTATVLNVPKKTLKSIDLSPLAAVRFDTKSETIRVVREHNKVLNETVYDLEGKVLGKHVVHARPERVDSPSNKYYYKPKHEVGEGDMMVRLSSNGRAVLKLPGGKEMGSRFGAIWDNPTWSPTNDDLLLLLYISSGFSEHKDLTEFDVFSVAQGRAIRVFSLEEKNTPAYGWTADGKEVVLCDVECSFYPVP